jgi:hypothetical protein
MFSYFFDLIEKDGGAPQDRMDSFIGSAWSRLSLFALSVAVVSCLPHVATASEANVASAVSNIKSPSSSWRGDRRLDELLLFVGQDSYLNRSAPPAGVTEYTQIGMHLRARGKSRFLSGTLDLGGSVATDVENYTLFEVPEAYVNWATTVSPSSPNTLQGEIVFGRKRHAWSRLDSTWEIGMFQPFQRFDTLRPSEQGLTGAFLQISKGQLDFGGFARKPFAATLFASPLYIPEQSAPFELTNGRFISRSPWFTPPPDSLILFGRLTKVNYKLRTPTAGEVINHPSVGLSLQLGDVEDNGFYSVASFAKKPRNSLSLPVKGQLVLTPTTNYGDVTVYPKVAYHNVGALDLGWRKNDLLVGLSGLTETVDREEVPSTLTSQNLAPIYLVSPSVEFRALPSRFWGPRMRVSYLKTIGGEVSVQGPLGSNGNVFGPRTLYKEAGNISFEGALVRRAKWQLDYGVNWIEEFSEQGTVVTSDLRLRLGQTWRINVSGDIIGSRKSIDDTSTFISRYRGNDRLSGRVTYVF